MNPEPSRPMGRLFRYLGNYRLRLSWSVFHAIANKLFDLMPPIMVGGWLIKSLEGSPPEWLWTDDVWQQVLIICGLIVLVFFAESFFEWRFQLGFRGLAQQVQHDLRVDAYDHLQHREIAYFERSRTGNLMAMLNDDINQLERFLNSGFVELLHLFVLVIFASLALFDANWQMGLIAVSAIPLIVIGSLFYQKLIAPHYQRIRERVGILSSRLENNLSGIMVIKSFASEVFEKARVSEASEDYRDVNLGAIRLNSAYIPVIRVFITFGFAGSLLLGAYWYVEGTHDIGLGELTLFAMMTQRLLWPITSLGRIFDDFERARASARRVFGLMDSQSELPLPEQPPRPTPFRGEVRFEQVDFHYEPALPILKNLNFDIPAGQTLGIAGPTGAGKTTLIKLLLRLYDVSSGKILVDGHDLRDFDLKYLRSKIALVSQDTYLFHGSVKENIAYGRESLSEAEIIRAAQQAQLHDFVASLPKGYDTIVGERGIKLSGGQRQRLSIARAILKDAPLLILDEATSSVDSETEAAIQENLDRLVEGRTAIIIAHRLSTLRKADRILVLRQGEIVEQGRHEALLGDGGTYADLWRVQVGG
jgi:ATP-binding cassette subfamily B protein